MLLFNYRNCGQCKQMYGPYFKGKACGDACLFTAGKFIPDCNNPTTVDTFLNEMFWN